MKLENFTAKYERAVSVTDQLARTTGYQEPATPEMTLDVATAWAAVVDEFTVIAQALAVQIARASVFTGAAVPMAARVVELKEAIQKARTAEIKERQRLEDLRFQGRA